MELVDDMPQGGKNDDEDGPFFLGRGLRYGRDGRGRGPFHAGRWRSSLAAATVEATPVVAVQYAVHTVVHPILPLRPQGFR